MLVSLFPKLVALSMLGICFLLFVHFESRTTLLQRSRALIRSSMATMTTALNPSIIHERMRVQTFETEQEKKEIPKVSNKTKPVKISAFVEALCPGCRQYTTEQIYPTFQQLGSKVMDLEIVPFGNAQVDKTAQKVTCQHGFAECDANIFELCAIHLYPYPERYLPFLVCLDEELPEEYDADKRIDASVFARCARNSALDYDSLLACHKDPDLAWKLQLQAAKKMPPNHKYVPWIVINGLHSIDEEKDSFRDAVCKAYEAAGGKHPACSSMNIIALT